MGGFDKILWAILGFAALVGGAIWRWSDAVTPFVSDTTNQGWIGFWGLYLTFFGLALALHQLGKVRSSTDAATNASNELLDHVRSTSRLFEIGELKRELVLLKSNIETKSLDAALQSLDAVRNRLGLLSELVKAGGSSPTGFEKHALMLDDVEGTLRKAKATNADLPDAIQMVLNIGIMQRSIGDQAAKLSLQSGMKPNE